MLTKWLLSHSKNVTLQGDTCIQHHEGKGQLQVILFCIIHHDFSEEHYLQRNMARGVTPKGLSTDAPFFNNMFLLWLLHQIMEKKNNLFQDFTYKHIRLFCQWQALAPTYFTNPGYNPTLQFDYVLIETENINIAETDSKSWLDLKLLGRLLCILLLGFVGQANHGLF